MVPCLVNYRPHSRRTPPSFFPCPCSHLGTHPTSSREEIPPFFSCTYVGPILQPFCSQILACNGGVSPSSTFELSNLEMFRRVSDLSPFFSHSSTLSCTFLHLRKTQPICFQAFPHSASKNTTAGGRAYPSLTLPLTTVNCRPFHRVIANWLSSMPSDKIGSLPTPCRQMDRAIEESL